MLGPYQFQPVFPLLQKYLQKPRALSLQPFSSKNQPFTEWQLQPYDFIRNGFCYDKAFEANVWGKTNRSVFKIKQTVYQEKGRFQLSNDVKFWFDLPRAGSLYLRFWTNNSFKLSYDHGLYAYKGQCYYIFGGTKGNKNLQNCDFRVGLGLVSQNFISENRLKYQRIKEKQENKYQWLHKTYIGHKRLRFGLMSVVDLSRSVLQKNNVLLGFYFKTGSCAFLRAQVNGFRHQNPQIGRPQTYFDHITADYIHDLSDKSKCAIEVKYSIKQKKIQEAVAVYQFEYEPKRRIKASFSNRMNLGILTKFPLFGLEQYADLSASLLFKDITGKNTTFQSGFQLNVNL